MLGFRPLVALIAAIATTMAALAPAVAEERAVPRQSWIIDSDMGIDDWLAILFMLASPSADVRGIVISGNGLSSCGPAERNALRLVKLAGREGEIPVACGSDTPLAGKAAFPQPWRDGSNDMLGLELPETGSAPAAGDSVTLLREVLGAAEKPLGILAIGPQTNLAKALEAEPALADKIGEVVVMGGAVHVPGNIVVPGFTDDHPNHAAEWNIHIDPNAAQSVFATGVPIFLVPLDATNQAPVNYDWLQRFSASARNPSAQFATDVLTMMVHPDETGEFYMWDILAAVLAVDRSLCRYEVQPLAVVGAEDPATAGHTAIDPGGRWTTVCTEPDVPAALALFDERL